MLTDDEIIDLFPDTDDGDGDIQYGRALDGHCAPFLGHEEEHRLT